MAAYVKAHPATRWALALLLAGAAAPVAAQDTQATRWHDTARTIMEKSVAFDTVQGHDKVPAYAAYLAGLYKDAGIPEADIHILPYGKTANLVVRWRAAGKPAKKPMLMLAHMDVVPADASDWGGHDPFKLREENGLLYGRGVSDNKAGIVGITTALLKLKAEGFKPARDLIVFFSGDEETEGDGAKLAATLWRNLIDAEFGLNSDGGGGSSRADGSVEGFDIQLAEKTYADFEFLVRNDGGHSSRPRPDNAIYQLSDALTRLSQYRFAPVLVESTRAYFTERQKAEQGALGNAMRAWLKNPQDGAAADLVEAEEVGMTRTRCVATMLNGGHAPNALPQLARAVVNCRIMPGVEPETIRKELEKIAADPAGKAQIEVKQVGTSQMSLASPLRADVMKAYTDTVHALHPGVPVIPRMSTGASDARPFRNAGIPVYGVNGSVSAPAGSNAHGKNERLPLKSLHNNVDHWVLLIRKLAG